MTSGLWACGTLGRAHGLHGQQYLQVLPRGLEYLDRGERFFLEGEGAEGVRPVRVERAGGTDRRPLVRLEGVETREQAVALQGRVLLAAGDALDEGDHWPVSRLVGSRVVSDGAEVGTVRDVLVNPAHDILEIEPATGGRAVLVPFVSELVDVDESGDTLVLTVRDGLLDLGPRDAT